MKSKSVLAGAAFVALVIVVFVVRGEPRADSDDTPGRLRDLERQIEQLRAEVDALADELAEAQTPAAAMGGADATGARDAIMKVLGSDDPDIRDQVHSILQEEMDRARDDRFSERLALRKEESAEHLEELATRVALEPDQQSQIYELLEAELDDINGIFRDARRHGGRRHVFMEAVERRTETDGAVGAILDEHQYGEYMIMRQEMRGELGRR